MTLMEEWKPILEYETSYEVSTLGRVRSLERCSVVLWKERLIVKHLKGRLLKDIRGSYGYRMVHLYKSGTREDQVVHLLVATAFLEREQEDSQVNHKDGNKKNNAVSNLEWCTVLENMQHAHRTKLINVMGENHPRSVLKEPAVLDILRRLRTGETQISIARYHKVSRSTVNQIKRGVIWRHLHEQSK